MQFPSCESELNMVVYYSLDSPEYSLEIQSLDTVETFMPLHIPHASIPNPTPLISLQN